MTPANVTVSALPGVAASKSAVPAHLHVIASAQPAPVPGLGQQGDAFHAMGTGEDAPSSKSVDILG